MSYETLIWIVIIMIGVCQLVVICDYYINKNKMKQLTKERHEAICELKELEERLFTLENQNSVYGFLGYKYEKVFFNVDTRLVKFSRELPGCKITTLKIISSKYKNVKIEIHQDELEKLIEQLKKGLE